MDFTDRVFIVLKNLSEQLGRRLSEVEWKAAHRAEYAKALKDKKKACIDERARDIFNVYPRREGGTAALSAISKSIEMDGFEAVLAKTTEYASAVARWPKNRRKSQDGRSCIPLPTTWYGNRRYFDDSKEWWAGTGAKEKEEKEALLIAEPEGWRFLHKESRFVTENIPWASIDTATQKWIIEHMPQRNTA